MLLLSQKLVSQRRDQVIRDLAHNLPNMPFSLFILASRRHYLKECELDFLILSLSFLQKKWSRSGISLQGVIVFKISPNTGFRVKTTEELQLQIAVTPKVRQSSWYLWSTLQRLVAQLHVFKQRRRWRDNLNCIIHATATKNDNLVLLIASSAHLPTQIWRKLTANASSL